MPVNSHNFDEPRAYYGRNREQRVAAMEDAAKRYYDDPAWQAQQLDFFRAICEREDADAQKLVNPRRIPTEALVFKPVQRCASGQLYRYTGLSCTQLEWVITSANQGLFAYPNGQDEAETRALRHLYGNDHWYTYMKAARRNQKAICVASGRAGRDIGKDKRKREEQSIMTQAIVVGRHNARARYEQEMDRGDDDDGGAGLPNALNLAAVNPQGLGIMAWQQAQLEALDQEMAEVAVSEEEDDDPLELVQVPHSVVGPARQNRQFA